MAVVYKADLTPALTPAQRREQTFCRVFTLALLVFNGCLLALDLYGFAAVLFSTR